MGAGRLSLRVLEPESDLEAHLEVRHLAVHDLAADLGDLEPVQVPERLRSALQRTTDRGLDAVWRGADYLRYPIRAISHVIPPARAGVIRPSACRIGFWARGVVPALAAGCLAA